MESECLGGSGVSERIRMSEGTKVKESQSLSESESERVRVQESQSLRGSDCLRESESERVGV